MATAAAAAISACAVEGGGGGESAPLKEEAFELAGRAEGPGGAPGASVPALDWVDCGVGFQCATANVPLDYREPKGRSIALALLRRPALDPAKRLGSLFVNPGGPGGSGVDLVQGIDPTLPQPLRDRFDLVGFDPRGVARSSALHCLEPASYQKAFAETTARLDGQGLERAERLGRTFNEACLRQSGDLLPYMGTEYVARDLDLLRAAVGDEKLTYLGFSYGTFIGTVYANLFPARVRALALDGAYDPEAYANRPYDYDLGQYQAVDALLGRFFAWCKQSPTMCSFGQGRPAEAFERLLARLDGAPIRGPSGEVIANGATFVYAVTFALNGSFRRWPVLAESLRLADELNGGPLLAGLPPDEFDFLTANTVVECADRAYPRDLRLLSQRLAESVRLAPFSGPALAYGPPGYDHSHAAACAQWPAARRSRYAGPFNARGAAPILVVGTTGDPDTPYRDAAALSRELDDARLVTFEGEGHSAFPKSACVRAITTSYLVDLTLPEDGAVCADQIPPQPPPPSLVRPRPGLGRRRLPWLE